MTQPSYSHHTGELELQAHVHVWQLLEHYGNHNPLTTYTQSQLFQTSCYENVPLLKPKWHTCEQQAFDVIKYIYVVADIYK